MLLMIGGEVGSFAKDLVKMEAETHDIFNTYKDLLDATLSASCK